VVDDRTLWSRHRQSPYAGRPITGQVIRTLVRGRCVYSVDQGPSDPGGGKVIRPC
jgi:dihydroorotase-like cyclic amidohydrolase